MQIRSNPYPVRFDRVDNALEAMVAPSVDSVSGLITGPMLNRAPVVEVHNTLQSPDGQQTEMFYRMEKMPAGIRITGKAGGEDIDEWVDTQGMALQVQGRIGQSSERLVISPVPGGFAWSGQVGEVSVRQQLALNPWTMGFQLAGQFGPVLLEAVGQTNREGTAMVLQGNLGGKPLTGSIEGGTVPDSMIVTREVDGYRWIQEIRAVGAEPPPEEPPAPPTFRQA